MVSWPLKITGNTRFAGEKMKINTSLKLSAWFVLAFLIASCGGGGSAGNVNTVSGNYGTIAGGWDNTTTGSGSAIGGGINNTASGHGSTIGGGNENRAEGSYSTIPGGSGSACTTAAGPTPTTGNWPPGCGSPIK